MYPVFVRVSFPPLGVAGDRSCGLALRSLSADQLRKVKSTPLLESRVGVYSIEELWSPPGGAAGAAAIEEYARLRDWHNAYVPTAWVRTAKAEARADEDDAAYKVLVLGRNYGMSFQSFWEKSGVSHAAAASTRAA